MRELDKTCHTFYLIFDLHHSHLAELTLFRIFDCRADRFLLAHIRKLQLANTSSQVGYILPESARHFNTADGLHEEPRFAITDELTYLVCMAHLDQINQQLTYKDCFLR
jgi:hypothetical protein